MVKEIQKEMHMEKIKIINVKLKEKMLNASWVTTQRSNYVICTLKGQLLNL
jgi:hypothetical protein